MDDWVCIRCLVAISSTQPHCSHCGSHRGEVSHLGSKGSEGDSPRVYTVRYEGSSRDDAEYRAEIDERRHALDGYVATTRRWVEAGWDTGDMKRVLSGLFVWGGVWRQHRDGAEKSILFGPPAVLEVTYTLEHQVPEEE
jgi:hypothetical protein